MKNRSDFPLNIIWRRNLDWFFSARIAPLVCQQSVVIRCGDYLVRLATKTGEVIEKFLVHERAGDGTLLLNWKQVLITDFRRRPERLSSLIAFDLKGKLQWRQDLEAIVGRCNASLVNEELVVLGVSPSLGQMLYVLDLDNGELLSSYNLEMGANALIPYKRGYIARNQTPRIDSYGLYRMDREASQYEPIVQDSVWNLSTENEIILIASCDVRSNQFSAEALNWDLNPLWSIPCQNGAICLDDKQVFFIEQEQLGEGSRLVCRVAETADLVWKSSSFIEAIEKIDAAGSYIFCSHMTGIYIFRREDGSQCGNFEGHFASPTKENGKLYFVGSQNVYCVKA